MNLQTLISILVVLVALICFTRVVSVQDVLIDRSQLAEQLNRLLRHPGWRIMENVKIKEPFTTNNDALRNPMAVMLEAISSNRNPVNEYNVFERYNQIWTVLRCKFAEILDRYRVLVQQVMWICRKEKREDKKTADSSPQRHLNCLKSLLTKLHDTSPTFRCMKDTLEFFYSIGPQSKPKQNVMVALQKLSDFTLDLKPKTLARLSENDIDANAIDSEIKSISNYIFIQVLRSNLHRFVTKYCSLPSLKEWNIHNLKDDFQYKISANLIPQETTLLQFLEGEIDCFNNEIFGSLFFDLGFVYDVENIVRIGII